MYKTMLFVFLLVSCSSQIRALTEDEKQKLVTPTIYYIPQYSVQDHDSCNGEDRMDLLDSENHVIVSSCRSIYRNCEMQGTCRVELDDQSSILINVDQRNRQGFRTFKKVNSNECTYGLGASRDRKKAYRQMCIDPFYSVAADLSIYNLGDVIYVPLLKGIVLPNGESHTGYVIVRDSGQRIKGVGRFDFFTGYLGMTRSNPFFKLGLGGGNLFPEYTVINGEEADRVRLARNFPYLKRLD